MQWSVNVCLLLTLLGITFCVQVAEVLSPEKCRLSVSGWFYGKPFDRPTPYVEPAPCRQPSLPLDVRLRQIEWNLRASIDQGPCFFFQGLSASSRTHNHSGLPVLNSQSLLNYAVAGVCAVWLGQPALLRPEAAEEDSTKVRATVRATTVVVLAGKPCTCLFHCFESASQWRTSMEHGIRFAISNWFEWGVQKWLCMGKCMIFIKRKKKLVVVYTSVPVCVCVCVCVCVLTCL